MDSGYRADAEGAQDQLFSRRRTSTPSQSPAFLITLFSGFAQAESESLSKNELGKEKSIQKANVSFQYKKLLELPQGEDGKPEIMPEEAETVRRIYRRCWTGAV